MQTAYPPAQPRTAMLQPEKSPVHQLVSKWWHLRQPFPHEVAGCRAAIFTAATHEVTANANSGKNYNPLDDRRFIWANQWIDLGEGSIKRIDDNVHALAALFFNPAAALSRKELAYATNDDEKLAT